ncbi:MFS transporter [Nocardioides hungaricus]
MTGVSDAGSIRLLLAGPAVGRTFAFALVGRLAYGLLPLCFLFTVRDASGSFTVAAASAATLGFATLVMPVQSGLVDRYGQRRVLPVFAACYASTLVFGAVLARTALPAGVWIVLGLLLGLTGPALGPAMRAQWREIAADGPQRRRAYSLDSVGEEALYLVGPIVAGVVLALGPAWVGLPVAAGLVAVGTTALALSRYRPPAARAERGPDRAAPGRRSVVRPLLGLLASLALFGAGGAAVFVGIAALADRAGRPGVAGVIEAAMATGVVVGGLVWARSGVADPSRRTLVTLLVWLALGQAAAAGVTTSLVLVGAVLAAGMLAASPVYVIAFSTADDLVPAEQRTEASTWVTVGANAGTATGTAVAGLAVGMGGAAPFVLAGVLTAAAAALVALL